MEVNHSAHSLLFKYQRLNETADRLRSLLAMDASETAAAWERRIMPLVGEFEELFRQWVVEKERGGYMQSVLEQRPTKSPVVDRLRSQQRGFVVELADLRRPGDPRRAGIEAMADKVARLRGLLEEIREHQVEANGLVQHVYCQEIGYPASC